MTDKELMFADLTREALRIAYRNTTKCAALFRKTNAIHEIKMQPFFGEYWPETYSDTIKIRRPVKSHDKNWKGWT